MESRPSGIGIGFSIQHRMAMCNGLNAEGDSRCVLSRSVAVAVCGGGPDGEHDEMMVYHGKNHRNMVVKCFFYPHICDSAAFMSITRVLILNSPPHIGSPHATSEPSDRTAANAC